MTTERKDYYTVAEASKILRVSENTIYTWVADKKLPANKIGDVIRIPYESLYPHKDSNNGNGNNKTE
jgi:excisionase family DNA binding protein